MKKLLRSTIVSFIVLALIVSMTACGGTKEDNANATTQQKTTASTSTESTSTAESTKANKKPVTLNIYGRGFAIAFPSGEQTDPVAKEIERVTGVKINIDSQPDETKYAALVASNDLPDISFLDLSATTRYSKQLIEGKSIIELDSLVASNAPGIAKDFAKQIAFSKKFKSDDKGKLYLLPGCISYGGASYIIAPWIRWDYYKEMGYPEIKSNEDLLKVLSDMLKAHPKNEDGKKMLGISPWFDWGTWSYLVFPAGWNGIINSGVVDITAADYTPKGIFENDNSSLWTGAKFWYQANQLGLLDPEAFTQKYDNAIQKVSENKTLMTYASWVPLSANQAFQQAGQLKGFQPIPTFTGLQMGNDSTPMGNQYVAISASCKTPDRAMDFLEYIYSDEGSRTILVGVKGQTWTVENGKAKMLPDALKAKQTDPNFIANTGAGKYANYAGKYTDVKDANGQYMDLTMEPDVLQANLTPLEKDFCSYFNVTVPNQVIEQRVEHISKDSTYVSLLAATPDDIKRIEDKITTYLGANLPKCVLAKSDSEFDEAKNKIIADIKEMGGDQVVAFYTKAWTDANAAYSSIN